MTKVVTGLVTTKDAKEAENIAKVLLDKRLVACCNIIPNIKSMFRWKGKIENANESLLIIKTKERLMDMVSEEIKSAHSYDVPAIEFMKISKGSNDFLEWINKETK